MNKILKIIVMICIIILFLLSGMYIGYKVAASNLWLLSYAACDDGCSIATKNYTTNMLTNETFECWDKCEKYINELKSEGKDDHSL